MVEDNNNHIIGITKSWANKDIPNIRTGRIRNVYKRSNRKKERGSYLLY